MSTQGGKCGIQKCPQPLICLLVTQPVREFYDTPLIEFGWNLHDNLWESRSAIELYGPESPYIDGRHRKGMQKEGKINTFPKN